jgi:hypothetical protein
MMMGATKQFMIEEDERERFEEVRDWLIDRRTNGGTRPLWRPVTDAEVRAAWSEFEDAEALGEALDGVGWSD